MMAIEMSCACGSSISISGDEKETEQIWHLTHRFTSAHQECGFVRPPVSDIEGTRVFKKRVFKPLEDDDE